MDNLNLVHREVAWIPGSEHSTCRLRRCSDQTVRLRQRGTQGCELPPPLAGLSALRSPDRHDAETVEQPFYCFGFRRAQPPNYLLDVDG